MSKTIYQSNLPNVQVKVNSFSINVNTPALYGRDDGGSIGSIKSIYSGTGGGMGAIKLTTGRSNNVGAALGAISSGTASPYTSNLGSGQAFDIKPSYYTVHMWLRLS